MNGFSLLIVGLGGSFAVIWLINYIPLMSSIFGRPYSPRLFACKLLSPFDAFITMFLVAGAWVGLGTMVTGIGMMVYNVITGIGLSLGVVFTKKVLVPRWEKQYQQMLDDRQEVVITGQKIKVG